MKSIKTFIIAVLYGALTAFCFLGACVSAHADELQGKCLIVQKTEKDNKPVDTGYTIKVDDKIYKIYRGPKGGMFYVVDGKKQYLTKKQKALIK